jgi:hypothetical protein
MATAKKKTTKKAPPTSKKAAKPTAKKAAGSKKAAETASAPPRARQRWKALSVAELQALYTEKVGRPTGSNERTYLIWKIREAEKGNVPIGPSKKALFDGPTTAITMKLEDSFLDDLDVAGKEDGFKTRLGYLRDLLGKGLQVRGRSDLASRVAV